MRMDKMTGKLQEALADAQSLAVGRDHQFIEPVHLMTALLDQEGGTTRHLLANCNVNVNALRSQLSQMLDAMPSVEGTGGDVLVSNNLGRLLNLTDKYAQKRGDQFISTELYLLAALEDKGELARVLKQAGLSRNGVERAIDEIRGGQKIEDPNAEEQRQALEKYTIDLTERAEQGKLDPVIGRDDEIRRVTQVLQRRTKNNPVLIGEPGVGKTAIVEGLAIRIVNGESEYKITLPRWQRRTRRTLGQPHEGWHCRQREYRRRDQHRYRDVLGRGCAACLGPGHIGEAYPQNQQSSEIAKRPPITGDSTHVPLGCDFGQERRN